MAVPEVSLPRVAPETTMWQHLERSRRSCKYFNPVNSIFPPEWEWPESGAFHRPFPGGF